MDVVWAVPEHLNTQEFWSTSVDLKWHDAAG